MKGDPDEQALALLRQRDPRGFDLAYGAYGARVRAFLLRLSGRKDLADDLLQHTFLRLAERGPELRADSDLRAWLFTVARNAYLSKSRALRTTTATTEPWRGWRARPRTWRPASCSGTWSELFRVFAFKTASSFFSWA